MSKPIICWCLDILLRNEKNIISNHNLLAKAIHMMKSVDKRVGSYNPIPENSKYLQTIIESTTLPPSRSVQTPIQNNK